MEMRAIISGAATYYIHFCIKMNVANIFVDRAASVILSPSLSKEEAGLRQRLHTHTERTPTGEEKA